MVKIVKRTLPGGVWQQLLTHTLRTIEDIKAYGTNELIRNGGGFVI
jgi:hypothetical protein